MRDVDSSSPGQIDDQEPPTLPSGLGTEGEAATDHGDERAVGAPEPGRGPDDQGRVTGEDGGDEEPGADLAKFVALISRNRVTIACAVVILVSVLWKIAFVSQYYFRQDDFEIMDLAVKSHLTWSYLTQGYVGHFFPGVFAVAWVLARVALYNWAAAAGVIVVLIAAASLAAWRLLRTLFGNRIEIVIPLALYLLAPIGFENYSLWNAGIESLPMQLAIFTSLEAHVRYVRTSRYRYAVTAAAWLVLGLVFDEKAAVIPLVLFAVTAGFLTRKRGILAAVVAAVRDWWRGWLLYLGLLVAYVVILVIGLHHSTIKPGVPTSIGAIGTFSWALLRLTVLPGMLGGPWRWFASSDYGLAYSWPPSALVVISAIVVLGFIGATIVTRRRSWRAWAILAGWIVLADMLPVILGRLQVAGLPGVPGLFGMESRYVSDSAAILAIAAGLAWLPVTGSASAAADVPGPRRRYFSGRWTLVALALTVVFVVGSVWSVQKFSAVTGSDGGAGRPYIANARLALAQTPPGTVIVNSQLPDNLMISWFLTYADTKSVLGPMSGRGGQVTWTGSPSGYYSNLKIFGTDGRLYPASLVGSATRPLPTKQSCSSQRHSQLVLTFPAPTQFGSPYMAIAYLAAPSAAGQSVTVTYGSTSQSMAIRPGVNADYFPVSGSARSVVIDDPYGPGLCVDNAVVGASFAAGFGAAIPAAAVSSG
jgi:hypothetical protein